MKVIKKFRDVVKLEEKAAEGTSLDTKKHGKVGGTKHIIKTMIP